MIVSNGCSFTEGYGLNDPEQAWPSQLARLLNQPYKNLALGGASNDRIARTLREDLVKSSPDLVVVGWTSYDRNELFHRDGFYVRATTKDCLVECELTPEDTEQLHKNWLAYNHNVWINYRNWIYNILFFQDYFEKAKRPFLFFSAFGNNYINEFINKTDNSLLLADQSYQWRDRKKYQPERTIHQEWQELVNLCDRIDLDKWAFNNQQTMQYHLKSSGYSTDVSGHPKSDGHLAWAKIIANKLK